ncbi:MAG TPA: DEAD/DEAH box helicase [Anaerolineales bacterium]|nr:DEAD/DEAH box helicase [Anaerolineales bacterium]
MYSQYLQDYIDELSTFAETDSSQIELLRDSMGSFIQILARRLGCTNDPVSSLLDSSLQLLAISNALSELDFDRQLDGGHYLVAVGLEQAGKLLARDQDSSVYEDNLPFENDHWYRLTLAFLHYMSGGHRIQAKAVLNFLEGISSELSAVAQYFVVTNALRSLYEGRTPASFNNLWEQLLFSDSEPVDVQQKRIFRLARIIRQRRRYALDLLGQDDVDTWLIGRNLNLNTTREFWRAYLSSLHRRGYTTFTNEQIGENGFDDWLQLDRDLLVLLPTGSGKTLVAELRTALSLAQGRQVVWILPTRPLVRQAKRNLRSAFAGMDVSVEELPITEDFIPFQFTNDFPRRRYVAVTTPERLASLIRTKREVLDNIGLLVVDEAQILFDSNRGATIEHVIQEMQRLVRDFRLILMSAMREDENRFRTFLNRLRGDIPLVNLISNTRPTRQMYGVITNDSSQDDRQLSILLYPPGVQTEDGTTDRPYSIQFQQRLPRSSNALSIANLVAQKLSSKDFRTVVFVYQKGWTESNAEKMASALTETINLPPADLERIHVELGRDSIIESTGIKRVSPHHAGLTTLEQHIVEKWVKNNQVNTVIATSTLAQGIDLPFDFSILSYTSRFIPGNRGSTPLSYSEIKNMLGRAGRAGLVSDGVCLISAMNENHSPKQVLDLSRRHFFHQQEQTTDLIGLSRLMASATRVEINEDEWLYELSGLDFPDSQTLISFVLNASENRDDIRDALIERLQRYPSIQDLQEVLGENLNVIEVLISHLEPLTLNIREATNNDPVLLNAIRLTGMPIEILTSLMQSLRRLNSLEELGTTTERADWVDNLLKSSIAACSNRSWYKSLFNDLNLNDTFEAIKEWRDGLPMSKIEQKWGYKNQERANRIAIGDFFNHNLSLIAQFWGAIGVCANLLFPEQNAGFEHLQIFTREGVSSVSEMEWLEGLGGIDRVLAHILAQNTPEEIADDDLRSYVRTTLRRWNEDRLSIPNELSQYTGALVSIFDDS